MTALRNPTLDWSACSAIADAWRCKPRHCPASVSRRTGGATTAPSMPWRASARATKPDAFIASTAHDARMFQLACQEQIVGAALAHRDAHAFAIHVFVALHRRIGRDEVGAFADAVRRRLQHVLAARRVDRDEGDVPHSAARHLDHFARRVERHQLQRHAKARRQLARQLFADPRALGDDAGMAQRVVDDAGEIDVLIAQPALAAPTSSVADVGAARPAGATPPSHHTPETPGRQSTLQRHLTGRPRIHLGGSSWQFRADHLCLGCRAYDRSSRASRRRIRVDPRFARRGGGVVSSFPDIHPLFVSHPHPRGRIRISCDVCMEYHVARSQLRRGHDPHFRHGVRRLVGMARGTLVGSPSQTAISDIREVFTRSGQEHLLA